MVEIIETACDSERREAKYFRNDLDTTFEQANVMHFSVTIFSIQYL